MLSVACFRAARMEEQEQISQVALGKSVVCAKTVFFCVVHITAVDVDVCC